MIRGWFKTDPKFHINPRHRAYGKARIDIAKRVKTQQDWDDLWKEPTHNFPFRWGNDWKQCVEYRVDDFAAEVGFLIDILGLTVNALGPDYAQFTSPEGDFYLGVASTPQGEKSTPPDAMRFQFMVSNLVETVAELERRGIIFEQKPQPIHGSSLHVGYFRTPHGICMDLWGEVDSLIMGQDVADVGKQEKNPGVDNDFNTHVFTRQLNNYSDRDSKDVDKTGDSAEFIRAHFGSIYGDEETLNPSNYNIKHPSREKDNSTDTNDRSEHAFQEIKEGNNDKIGDDSNEIGSLSHGDTIIVEEYGPGEDLPEFNGPLDVDADDDTEKGTNNRNHKPESLHFGGTNRNSADKNRKRVLSDTNKGFGPRRSREPTTLHEDEDISGSDNKDESLSYENSESSKAIRRSKAREFEDIQYEDLESE